MEGSRLQLRIQVVRTKDGQSVFKLVENSHVSPNLLSSPQLHLLGYETPNPITTKSEFSQELYLGPESTLPDVHRRRGGCLEEKAAS